MTNSDTIIERTPNGYLIESQIYRNGAAWSTSAPYTLASEIERVEKILHGETYGYTHGPHLNRRDGWIECDYRGCDENGREGTVHRPVTIEIRRMTYDAATRRWNGVTVARWVRGERVS